MWILKDSLSLQQINNRLRGIRIAANHHREQLLDASGAIDEATADIDHYVRTTIGQAQEVEEGHEMDIVDVRHKIKRLEIKIAESRRTSRDSSSSTELEDIIAYAGSREECDDSLQLDDAESATSA